MPHFLAEFALPFVAAFSAGLFQGWLLWRWRRQGVDAQRYAEVATSASAHEAELTSLGDELRRVTARADRDASRVGALNRRLADAERDRRSADDQVAQLRRTASTQLQRLASLEMSAAELATMKRQNEVARAAVARLKDQLETALLERKRLHGELDEALTTHSTLKRVVEAEQAKRAELQRALDRETVARARMQADRDHRSVL